MGRTTPLPFAVVAAVAAVAVACGGGGDPPAPGATVGTAPTTTTTPADLAVVPPEARIDEGYVQAVVDALYAVDAGATRIFVETRALDQRAIDHLAAIYVEDEMQRQVNTWAQSLAVRADQLLPGTVGNDVQRVIDVAPDCVYVKVLRDYSETTRNDRVPDPVYLGLTPKIPGEDPEGLNPTAWMVFMDGVNLDGSQPENPCAGR